VEKVGKLFGILGSIIEVLSRGAGGVVAFCIATAVVLTTYGVVMRYAVNQPPLFVVEYDGYLMLGVTFMGMAYALREGAHIKLTILTEHLSKRVQNLLEAITLSVGLVFTGFFIKWVYTLWLFSWEQGVKSVTAMETFLWIPQTAMLIGFPLLALQLIVVIVRRVKAFRSANQTPGMMKE